VEPEAAPSTAEEEEEEEVPPLFEEVRASSEYSTYADAQY
jgi:hypothetical protein